MTCCLKTWLCANKSWCWNDNRKSWCLFWRRKSKPKGYGRPNVLIEVIESTVAKYLIRDRDGIYGEEVQRAIGLLVQRKGIALTI